MRILLSAYACEPNRDSEAGVGWNWAFHLTKAGHTVHLLTSSHGRNAIEIELAHQPQPNLHVHYVDVPRWSMRYMKGQFGVYAHYFLWQYVALEVAWRLRGEVDLVYHVTWGSLHGGSPLYKLGLPFVFGPVGGGQVGRWPWQLFGECSRRKGARNTSARY